MTGLTEAEVEALKEWLRDRERYWTERRLQFLKEGFTSMADQCEAAEDAYAEVLLRLTGLRGG